MTQALLLINVAAFFLDSLTGQLLSNWLALWPIGPHFLPFQVVTYAFLHGNFGHLFFNMIGLWTFGSELERLWGPKRFLQFYAASVLAAAAAQLLVTWLLGSFYPTLGASGGLFGLLLAFGMMFPHRTVMLIIPPIPLKARTLVIGYGALELFFGVTGTQEGVAHFAHLGGMLGGFLMIRYWRGQPPFRGRRRF
ncbi:MAG TPA: rhomboid family intramembrane serine protease [Albitalea sp.]|nr:rhomboid family intramembrane serine protease [Albitalea sp.]